jgi:hypothetical protein
VEQDFATLARLLAQTKRDAEYWQEAFFRLQGELHRADRAKRTGEEDRNGIPVIDRAAG